MERFFINADEVKIKRGSLYTLDIEFFDGRKYEGLEVRELFPLSGPTRYISLVTDKNEEIAIIRNLDLLMEDSKRAVQEVLYEYYRIPKIMKIIDREEKYGILKWKVLTDKGIQSFDIQNRQSDIKVVYGRRVFIRDTNDNRYEIPDYEELDVKSMKKIYSDL